MYVIWNRHGWLVPVVFIVAFVGTQLGLDAWEPGTYESAEWPKYLAIGICSVALAVIGFLLNRTYRERIVDEETGEERKAPSHHFFFIPIEYWALVVPLFFVWTEYEDVMQESEVRQVISAPQVGDIYFVDLGVLPVEKPLEYSKGSVKVIEVENSEITLQIGEKGYKTTRGLKRDFNKGMMKEPGYFAGDPVTLKIEQLARIEEAGLLYGWVR